MFKKLTSLILISIFAGCTGCQGPQPKEELFVTNAFQSLESSVLIEFGYKSGSGFVIGTGVDEEKQIRYYKIITAAHVVTGSYSEFLPSPMVTFTINGDKKLFSAEVVKKDNFVDLALLQIWTTELEPLCLPFKIASDNSYLNYFGEVLLVSYPAGLGPIATKGIIAGVDVLDPDPAFVSTAQSAPGSSGGSLVSIETGEVIGVLKSVLRLVTDDQLLGWFSIMVPASEIRRFVSVTPLDEDGFEIIPGADRGKTNGEIKVFIEPSSEIK